MCTKTFIIPKFTISNEIDLIKLLTNNTDSQQHYFPILTGVFDMTNESNTINVNRSRSTRPSTETSRQHNGSKRTARLQVADRVVCSVLT